MDSGEEHMEEKLRNILDNIRVNVYVTDVYTHQIIYMNQEMKKNCGEDKPEGKICWKIFHKEQERMCDYCKIPQLLQQQEEDPVICWRRVSEKNGRMYERYDSLIQWGGRLVHLQQCYDITEQARIEEQASRDWLCSVWNRGTGKQMLAQCLEKMEEDGHTYTAVLLDVDNLKGVNDSYGHNEGDFLLKNICQVLQASIRENDFMFRLSGDEFVLVLRDVGKQEGIQLMETWRKETEKLQSQLGKPYEFSFSFGVCHTKEDHIRDVAALIAKADERMYEEKLERRKRYLADEKYSRQFQDLDSTARRDFEYPSELLYDALSGCMDDTIFFCNVKTKLFRYPAPFVEEFGLPGEIIEKPVQCWRNTIHPDDWNRFYMAYMEIKEKRKDTMSVEMRVRNKSGVYVPLSVRGRMACGQDGTPGLFAGIIKKL